MSMIPRSVGPDRRGRAAAPGAAVHRPPPQMVSNGNQTPASGVPAAETESVEGRPLDDQELVERARGGDARAYEALVRRYQELAFRTAWVIAGTAADAEDAAQDGFVKAWSALGRFRAGAPFRPWLLQIVANEARNRRRSAGRRVELAVRAAGQRPPGG